MPPIGVSYIAGIIGMSDHTQSLCFFEELIHFTQVVKLDVEFISVFPCCPFDICGVCIDNCHSTHNIDNLCPFSFIFLVSLAMNYIDNLKEYIL
jgi:hypothetical protein